MMPLSLRQLSRTRSSLGVSLSVLALGLAGAAYGQSSTPSLGTEAPAGISGATVVGKPSASQILHLTIALPPANRVALEDYANRVSDPKAATYRRFLTPEQVGVKFGQSDTTVSAVASYLKSKGFTIRLIGKSRFSIQATATVKQAETAFSTKINNYRAATVPVGTQQSFFSNATPLKLPSSIASKVTAITGVSNYFKPKPMVLTVTQTRNLYNLAGFYASGFHGEGISVGISNWDGYSLANLVPFYSTYSLAAPDAGVGKNVTKVPIDGVNGETIGAQGEMDLDIQMVLGMVPRCNLFLYDNAGGADLLGVLTQEANDNNVDIISESWEWRVSDTTAQAAHDLHLQMTLQGITYMSAAGDYGAPGRPLPYPHVEPEVLSIGGTIAKVDGAGIRSSEVTWSLDSSGLGGGGGWFEGDGASQPFNVRPAWQDLSVFGFKPSVNHRLFPDISLNAAGDGSGAYYFFQGGQLNGGSVGTSFASPVFAGQLATTIQALIAQGGIDPTADGKYRLGRIQDQIYAWQGRPDVFFDVTQGNIGALPDGTIASATTGWDLATGWGAVDINGLVGAFLENASIQVVDDAATSEIYSSVSPNLTLGVNPTGDVTELPEQDGLGYSIESVRQNGVGQVAAANIGFALTGDAADRRKATLKLVANSPKGTTGFIYLGLAGTGAIKYDVIKTFTGSDGMVTVNLDLDLDKYVNADGTVNVLVRGMKPSRLGPTPFRLTVDQAKVTEFVKRS